MGARPGSGRCDVIAFDISATGPLFDGRAEQIALDLAADAVDTVGEVAEQQVVRLMELHFQNPRPWYWLQVTRSHPGYLTTVVHDTGIVYGPWLEGVGSRNATTRFKGYRHWRTTRQEIESQVLSIIEPVVEHHVARLGG